MKGRNRINTNETTYNPETGTKAMHDYYEANPEAHKARCKARPILVSELERIGVDPRPYEGHHVKNGNNDELWILLQKDHIALHKEFGRKNEDCSPDRFEDSLLPEGNVIQEWLDAHAGTYFIYRKGQPLECRHGAELPIYVPYKKHRAKKVKAPGESPVIPGMEK